MIHIVFQTSDVHVLQQAMALDPDLAGDVLQIYDDLAVGPLRGLDAAAAGAYDAPDGVRDAPDGVPGAPDGAPRNGWQIRRDWWKTLLEYTPYTFGDAKGMPDDQMTIHRLKQTLDADPAEEVWVWMAQNAHDVCGYYWLVNRLRDYQGRVQVLYLNNLPFINEKGAIFYPVYLFEIQPSEFRKAKRLARPITPSEFEIDPDEWARLCSEDAGARVLEGGKKVTGHGYDYYDKNLLAVLTTQWQKVHRVIGNTLGKMKVKTGDVYLFWRLRELLAAGVIEWNGDIAKGWNATEVKLPGGTAPTEDAGPAAAPQTPAAPQFPAP